MLDVHHCRHEILGTDSTHNSLIQWVSTRARSEMHSGLAAGLADPSVKVQTAATNMLAQALAITDVGPRIRATLQACHSSPAHPQK